MLIMRMCPGLLSLLRYSLVPNQHVLTVIAQHVRACRGGFGSWVQGIYVLSGFANRFGV